MKNYLIKKILIRIVCCLLAVSLIYAVLFFYHPAEHYLMWLTIDLTTGLEYEAQYLDDFDRFIVCYIRQVEDEFRSYEIGIYPYLTDELEAAIRERWGWPYSSRRVRYAVVEGDPSNFPDSYRMFKGFE